MPTSGRSRRIGRQPTPGYWRWITSWTCQLRLTGLPDPSTPSRPQHPRRPRRRTQPRQHTSRVAETVTAANRQPSGRPQPVNLNGTQRTHQRRTRTATTSPAQSKRMAANLVRDIPRGDETGQTPRTDAPVETGRFSHGDRTDIYMYYVNNTNRHPGDEQAHHRKSSQHIHLLNQITPRPC